MADPGMNYLNFLLDGLFLSSVRSGEAQDRYESGIVREAREIASGDTEKAANAEHLRVLLNRLDSAGLAQEKEDGDPPF